MTQSFKLALRSIAGSKMRSFLTMLGMIIGVASVIILVSLMQGMTNYMSDSFSDLGTNQISVNLTNTDTRSVSDEDLYQFFEEHTDLFQAVSPIVSVQGTVKSGTDALTSSSISGVGEGYLTANTLELSSGRFVQYSDLLSRQKVCAIGSYVAREFFGGQNAVGQTLKINGEAYVIVGVLSEKAESEEGSADDCVYLPYTVATKLARSANISNYIFSVYDVENIDSAKALLKEELYQTFHDEDLYTVTSLSEMLEMVESMTGMMTLVLVGIAGISLLVAGIGIMNIMLVSVKERTREIGIRKSLGAKRRTILRQFIIEAGLTSAMGGLLGVGFGIGCSLIIGSLIGLSATPSVGAILLAFGVSAGIGVLFGYIPARRAARLNPIDALRSD